MVYKKKIIKKFNDIHTEKYLKYLLYSMIIINFFSIMIISSGFGNFLRVFYTDNSLNSLQSEFMNCKWNIVYIELFLICFAYTFTLIIKRIFHIRTGHSQLKFFTKNSENTKTRLRKIIFPAEIDITNFKSLIWSILLIFSLFMSELIMIILIEKALYIPFVFTVILNLSQLMYLLFSIQLSWVIYFFFWLSEIALIFLITRRIFVGVSLWLEMKLFRLNDIMLLDKNNNHRLHQMDYTIYRIHKCLIKKNKEQIPIIIDTQFRSFVDQTGYFQEVFLLYSILRFCSIFELVTNDVDVSDLLLKLEEYQSQEKKHKNQGLFRLYELFSNLDKKLTKPFFHLINNESFISTPFDNYGFQMEREFYWATFFIHMVNNIKNNNMRSVFHLLDNMFYYQFYTGIKKDTSIYVYPYRFLFLFKNEINQYFDKVLKEIKDHSLQENDPLIGHPVRILQDYARTF